MSAISRTQLQRRLAGIEMLVSIPSAVILIVVLSSAVDFEAHHLRFSVGLVALLGTIFSIAGFRFKAKSLCHTTAWLDQRGDTPLDPAATSAAFEQAANFPLRMAGFFAAAWLAVGMPAALSYFFVFDDFGARPTAMMAAGTFCLSLIAVSCDYILAKRVLAPVRNAIAGDLPEPEERAALVRPVPLGMRLLLITVSFMLFMAYTGAVLATGQSSGQIKSFFANRHDRVLDRVEERIGGSTDLQLATPYEAGLLEAAGVYVSVYDLELQQLQAGWSGIPDEDLRFLSIEDPEERVTHPSASLLLSQRRLDDPGVVLVASTPLADYRAGMAIGAVKLAAAIIAVLGAGVLMAALFARDLVDGIEGLRLRMFRVAGGDLTEAEPYEAEDELGDLARAVDRMQRELRRVLDHLASVASELLGAGEALSRVSTEAGQASHDQEGECGTILAATLSVQSQLKGLAGLAAELDDSSGRTSEAILELQAMGGQLQETGVGLQHGSSQSVASSEHMLASNREAAESSEDVYAVVARVGGELERFLAAISEVASGAGDSAALSSTVIQIASEGEANVGRTLEGMHEIQGASVELDRAFSRLGTASSSIGEVTAVIEEIATDTNLLAINASIIAAQAGEHGRAFEVVAREVNSLANRVQSNTRSIHELVANLDEHTTNARSALDRSKDAVSSGLGLAETAQRSLEQITQAAQTSAERTNVIVDEMSRQGRETEQLAGAMDEARTQIGSIKRILDGNLGGSSAAIEQATRVDRAAIELQNATAAHADQLARISTSAAGVSDGARTVNETVELQAAACEEMTTSVEVLKSRVEGDVERFERISELADRFQHRADSLRGVLARFGLVR